MSLEIIKDDLLHINCDGLVNLIGYEDLNQRIYEACGKQLKEELAQTSDFSSAVITSSYDLTNVKHIIHIVVNQIELLEKCYQNILELAKDKQLTSIAIPLVSDFFKRESFEIARSSINSFLENNEMTVYLVVCDKGFFTIEEKLAQKVKTYISCNYLQKPIFPNLLKAKSIFGFACNIETNEIAFTVDKSFSEMLMQHIDEKGLKDPEVYKKAGIDRKLFSSIRSNRNYHPSKKTAIVLCIALELDLNQTNDLLKRAGFALSNSNLFDVIIEYFISKKHYDIYDINAVLLENDQELI